MDKKNGKAEKVNEGWKELGIKDNDTKEDWEREEGFF